MNKILPAISFIIFICLSGSAETQSAPAKTLPLPPPDLLTLLPSPPKEATNWKLNQSIAFNSYEDYWLRCEARRVYTTPPGKEGDPAPDSEITLRLLDTAKSSPLLDMFKDFKEGTNPLGANQLINGAPSILRSYPEMETLSVLIANRFILFVVAKKVPPGFSKEWVDLDLLTKLSQIPSPAATEVPRPFAQERIDELHPQSSFKNQGTFLTKAEFDAFQAKIAHGSQTPH